jgi:26S proteasome regulatory subunit N6
LACCYFTTTSSKHLKLLIYLKYMLLCKIIVNQADDVAGIISPNDGLKYLGPDINAMKAVADAYSKRSLKYFETALCTKPS